MSILRLKEILKEKGISGKDLAEKVGVSQPAISDITNGKSYPRPDLLLQIANALDVDIRDLFYPTKDIETETIYALRDGTYVPIGELRKTMPKE